MLSYFCESNTGRYFLYVPFNLFGYDSLRSGERWFRWDPDFLAKLTLLLKEGRINREKLERKGWDVYEFDIPDKKLEKFRYFCLKSKKTGKILRVVNNLFSHIENKFDDINELEEMTEEQEDDYEDYLDDWWLRGEEPPFDLMNQ